MRSNAKTSHDDAISAEIRKCPQCGDAFIPKRRNQRYCSSACRKNASRSRRKGDADAPAPVIQKPRHRIKTRGKSRDLSREDFEDMVEPLGSYEDMLRLTVRRLKKEIENPSTSSRDLPALSRQLLQSARQLEQFEADPAEGSDDMADMEVDDDISFRAEAI